MASSNKVIIEMEVVLFNPIHAQGPSTTETMNGAIKSVRTGNLLIEEECIILVLLASRGSRKCPGPERE